MLASLNLATTVLREHGHCSTANIVVRHSRPWGHHTKRDSTCDHENPPLARTIPRLILRMKSPTTPRTSTRRFARTLAYSKCGNSIRAPTPPEVCSSDYPTSARSQPTTQRFPRATRPTSHPRKRSSHCASPCSDVATDSDFDTKRDELLQPNAHPRFHVGAKEGDNPLATLINR